MKVVGTGAGTKDFPSHPNVVRVLIGDVITRSNNTAAATAATTTTTTSIPASVVLSPQSRERGREGEGTLTKLHTTSLSRSDITEGKSSLGCSQDEVVLLECNIDDMTAELLGHLIDLFVSHHKARDCWVEAVVMKKSRPGRPLIYYYSSY